MGLKLTKNQKIMIVILAIVVIGFITVKQIGFLVFYNYPQAITATIGETKTITSTYRVGVTAGEMHFYLIDQKGNTRWDSGYWEVVSLYQAIPITITVKFNEGDSGTWYLVSNYRLGSSVVEWDKQPMFVTVGTPTVTPTPTATVTATATATATPTVCTTDTQKCPDGSYVSRDPLNNCQFRPCSTNLSLEVVFVIGVLVVSVCYLIGRRKK